MRSRSPGGAALEGGGSAGAEACGGGGAGPDEEAPDAGAEACGGGGAAPVGVRGPDEEAPAAEASGVRGAALRSTRPEPRRDAARDGRMHVTVPAVADSGSRRRIMCTPIARRSPPPCRPSRRLPLMPNRTRRLGPRLACGWSTSSSSLPTGTLTIVMSVIILTGSPHRKKPTTNRSQQSPVRLRRNADSCWPRSVHAERAAGPTRGAPAARHARGRRCPSFAARLSPSPTSPPTPAMVT